MHGIILWTWKTMVNESNVEKNLLLFSQHLYIVTQGSLKLDAAGLLSLLNQLTGGNKDPQWVTLLPKKVEGEGEEDSLRTM